MILFTTLKAEDLAATAFYLVFSGIISSFHNLVAVFSRTPFESSIFLCELLAVPLKILLKVINFIFLFEFRQKFKVNRVWNYNIAS